MPALVPDLRASALMAPPCGTRTALSMRVKPSEPVAKPTEIPQVSQPAVSPTGRLSDALACWHDAGGFEPHAGSAACETAGWAACATGRGTTRMRRGDNCRSTQSLVVRWESDQMKSWSGPVKAWWSRDFFEDSRAANVSSVVAQAAQPAVSPTAQSAGRSSAGRAASLSDAFFHAVRPQVGPAGAGRPSRLGPSSVVPHAGRRVDSLRHLTRPTPATVSPPSPGSDACARPNRSGHE